MKKTALFLSILVPVVFPFVPLLLWSFAEKWFYPSLLPEQFGMRAWTYVFNTAGSQILTTLSTSFSLAITTAIISLILGVPAGRALGLYEFPGKKTVMLFLLLPIIVPPLSVSMGLHFWFIKISLAESFFGVVLIHLTFCLPYTIYVLLGVFSDYNPDYEAQAQSLGASPFMILSRVTLPMILPGIIVAALFSFLLSWSQYLSTLIIGGGRLLTLPILLFSLMASGDRPVAAAVSIVFILPALLALTCSAHYLGRTGLKGIR
jgi:putative spermidine/putrescine transport system permease protein